MTPPPEYHDALTGDDFARLSAYVAGEGDAAERVATEAWINASSARIRALQAMKTVWQTDGDYAVDHAVSSTPRAWMALRAVMAVPPQRPMARPQNPRRGERRGVLGGRTLWGHAVSRRLLWPGALSSMLALAGLLVGVTLSNDGVAPAVRQTYHTLAGQRVTVRFARRVIATLGPSTRLDISGTEVHVTGEAYFAVTPRLSQPVVVRTRNSMVRVLGTHFTVRQYSDERATQVAVEDGKVAIQQMGGPAVGREAIATANTLVTVTDSSVDARVGTSISEYTSWVTGRLVFNEVPLRDVARELARAYGVEIQLADSALLRRKMTLAVSVTTESIADVLHDIAFTIDAHSTRTGNRFVIAPGVRETVPHPQQIPQSEKQYGK